jgi:hypothetical protein
VLLEAL